MNLQKQLTHAAKQAKSDETYPDEMIAKIDSTVTERARLAAEAEAAEQARLAALQAEKERQYSDAVAQADEAFNQKEYENARTAYRSALNIKPEENYPQQQIDKIGDLMAELLAAQKEQEQLNKNYENAIQAADKLFTARNFPSAKTNYVKALEIKPDEQYPVTQIAEIERLIKQKETDEKYRTVILAADGFFRTRTYPEARAEYEKAVVLKPDEQYPQSQIGKIDDILSAEQKRLLAEQQAAADLERRRNEIRQQQDIQQEQTVTSDAELSGLYDDYIARADESFDGKMYNVSRAWYYRAWDVKPEENYPPQRIDEINRLVNGMLLSQRDRDYQKFVNLGDSTFRENQLAVARGWYNQALNMKPAETYPKDQLNEISNRIAERLAGQSGHNFKVMLKKQKQHLKPKISMSPGFGTKKHLN